jgi:hypothetical protein
MGSIERWASSARWALRGGLLATGILLGAAPAAATDERPPPDTGPAPPPTTVPVPPPTGIGNPLAQAGSGPAGPFGLPDLSGYETNLILGQNPVPSAPDTPAPATLPSLSAFNPEYLLAQNQAPAPPGEGVIAPGLGPMPDDPGTGRIAFLRRLHEMYQGGALTGALLGQVPPDERDGVLPAPEPEPVGYPSAAPPPAG